MPRAVRGFVSLHPIHDAENLPEFDAAIRAEDGLLPG
ncbi:unnamed protein product, partial [marine sediment metagenome]